MTMQLKSLVIKTLENWEKNYAPGKLHGTIALSGMAGEIAFKLNDQQCHAIMKIVAESARDHTQEAVNAMTAEVFNLPTPELIEG